MGQRVSMLPAPVPGAVVVVIESGGQCQEECNGRTWDVGLQQPAFVGMSSAEWQTFCAEMDTLVRSFKNEGKALYGIVLVFIAVIVFNPSINLAERELFMSYILLYGTMMIGIFGTIKLQLAWRAENIQVDGQIRALCARTSTLQAEFTYQTMWTEACKPKGARTYRALCIAPAGSGLAPSGVVSGVAIAQAQPIQPATETVQVTCPPTNRPGDVVQIATASGQQMTVVVPAGVQPGGTFLAQVPTAPPTVAVATAVPV